MGEHVSPETSPEMPDFESRCCPRSASFSWYLYSPHRIRYPYLRGELAELWREARKISKTALEAWQSIATDQWRNEEIDTAQLVSPATPRYRHSGDYNIMAARLGWLPAYPCFNKIGQKIFDEAKAAGFEGIDGIRKFVAQSLKNRTLEFSWEDPDAPENFPRNLFIWRNNLIGSSSKGH
ncbi:MAG: molybdopterin-dependent oxidoreductase, partial [Selenomonadaceae bacterium]|nr:molybdopterin-dependent oxidoreductase [Selenomonadaceae bacterium]